mmetsp:Transcript_17997/g.36276  ORF Transcript_17997/g.36276 Transcript_17997/m.36276 type:complete len:168 (-) Transcript_17997:214-717(-)|eukprot:CAMPEP_0174748248 /NCGR_PEP_ID=MMETSP1094-20130205/92994_1 /TAXON_ID=156173 /ORGANISM="Chrysochromulina brevifilum, Strain UTEX LB 985" /LENGTH=167 /DNA_ID=CAMNT_0015953245 /DNA_START=245 /DNA_END=748 /DNA_ORIENTATION=-
MSRDLHERMTQLGYVHVAPPAVAGMSAIDARAWRLADTREQALRRFFVGGAEELSDLRSISIPEGFDLSTPQCLNKHGLLTTATGTLHLEVNTIIQQQQPPAAPKPPARPATTARKLDLARSTPADLSSLRGVVGVNALARSQTAADRVRQRLEERRRAEAQDAPSP